MFEIFKNGNKYIEGENKETFFYYFLKDQLSTKDLDNNLIENVKYFLHYGADPNILIDGDGEFFINHINQKLSKKICEDLLHILIEYGLDVNLKNVDKQNMGFFSYSNTLEFLLKKGLNPNQTDINGDTILINLINRFVETLEYEYDIIHFNRYKKDYIKQIKILSDYNIDYNHQNNQGETIMHTLCKINFNEKDQRDLFFYFYEKGALLNIENNDGEKPLIYIDNLSLYYLLNESFNRKDTFLIDELLSYIDFSEIDDEFNLIYKIEERKNKIALILNNKICNDVTKYEVFKFLYPKY
jgi:hypothetical protein